MRLAWRRDLVQRAARQPSAENGVDAVDAERQRVRPVTEHRRLFQGAQGLAQLRELHH